MSRRIFVSGLEYRMLLHDSVIKTCLFAFEIQYGAIVMVVVKGEEAGQKGEYMVAEYASDVAPGMRWGRY